MLNDIFFALVNDPVTTILFGISGALFGAWVAI